MKTRIFSTIAIFIGWGVLSFVANRPAPIVSAGLAGRQFDNSNLGYGESQLGFLFNGAGWLLWLPLLLLLAVWWKPIRRLFPTLAAATLFAGTANAYYDKTDYAEAVFILPNESAFFIPDVGANRDSQVKFGALEYYEENKIAAKRFQIPHQKFSGSGYWADYYVPTGRLIIVDRSPYNREWTAAANRGSSPKNESFPCQTSEGLNVTIEMAVAATVAEENAARFLYHFGVNPPAGDRTKPEVIFTSVYYGRSLKDVMDNVGRGEVQTLTCDEISKRTLDKANAEMATMLAA